MKGRPGLSVNKPNCKVVMHIHWFDQQGNSINQGNTFLNNKGFLGSYAGFFNIAWLNNLPSEPSHQPSNTQSPMATSKVDRFISETKEQWVIGAYISICIPYWLNGRHYSSSASVTSQTSSAWKSSFSGNDLAVTMQFNYFYVYSRNWLSVYNHSSYPFLVLIFYMILSIIIFTGIYLGKKNMMCMILVFHTDGLFG